MSDIRAKMSEQDLAIEAMFWSRILPGLAIVFIAMILILGFRRRKLQKQEDSKWLQRKEELDEWERQLLKAQRIRAMKSKAD
jgi:preprotein translocase subunit SecG